MNLTIKKRYSQLLLKIGLNLQAGDNILIKCPVEHHQFGQMLVEDGYQLGANRVIVDYTSEQEQIEHINNQDLATLLTIDAFTIEYNKMLATSKFKVLTLVAPRFDLKPLDLAKANKYKQQLTDKTPFHRQLTNSDQLAWCIAALPTESWAKKVFGDNPQPYKQLVNTLIEMLKIKDEDYLQKWQLHVDKLKTVSNYLNEQQFEYLQITNKHGTNIKIGLIENHRWKSAGSNFVANLPTEEVYTMPNKFKVEGTIVATKPLIVNNVEYHNLRLHFKDGSLQKLEGENCDLLQTYINTSENGKYLGEIALVDRKSSIYEQDVVMYNMLFDENAGAHLALGNSFPANLQSKVKEQELPAAANRSNIHVDIVFGSDDLNVIGIGYDQKSQQIMENGLFII